MPRQTSSGATSPPGAAARPLSSTTRGISDHSFIHSVYFRDPSGYVIELTAKQSSHAQATDPAQNGAREKLDRWQAAKVTQ